MVIFENPIQYDKNELDTANIAQLMAYECHVKP